MIYLQSLEKTDNDTLRKWRNTPEIARRFFSQDFISIEKQEQWYEKISNNPKEINWIIKASKDDVLVFTVGTAALIDIDLRNRKAEYARLLIDPKFKRKGFAFDAEKKILEFGFNYLNLNKIYCYDFGDNIEVNNLHYKTGFKKVGAFKQHIFREGKYEDVIILEIMRNEWLKLSGL